MESVSSHDSAFFGPSPEAVDVWGVRFDQSVAHPEGAWALLSAAERERAELFRVDDARQRFVVTRAALRTLLSRYLGAVATDIALEEASQGKPRLAGALHRTGLHFNVAHSGSVGLIAVAIGCEVGVDVEWVRPVTHAGQIARRFFHPVESLAVSAAARSARDAAFLRCWTGKEAVLKAIGSGITGSLASFCVPTESYNAMWIDMPSAIGAPHERCWLQEVVPCAGYAAAVACFGVARRLRVFEFEF